MRVSPGMCHMTMAAIYRIGSKLLATSKNDLFFRAFDDGNCMAISHGKSLLPGLSPAVLPGHHAHHSSPFGWYAFSLAMPRLTRLRLTPALSRVSTKMVTCAPLGYTCPAQPPSAALKSLAEPAPLFHCLFSFVSFRGSTFWWHVWPLLHTSSGVSGPALAESARGLRLRDCPVLLSSVWAVSCRRYPSAIELCIPSHGDWRSAKISWP